MLHTLALELMSTLNLIALQAIKLLHMTKVFGKSMRVNKASQDKDSADVGANLFIGNLDPDLDEKVSSDNVCRCRAWCCVRQVRQSLETNVWLLFSAHSGDVSSP